MKKILYVTTLSRTINAFLIPHIEMLVDMGHKVDIACYIDKEVDSGLLNRGIKCHNISFCRKPSDKKNLIALKEIRKIQAENNYDIVHVHTPVASFVTRIALRNERVKMIYTAHGFHFYKGAPLLNWLIYYPLEKIAAKWTDKIVTINSEDLKRANRLKLRNNGLTILMHGVGVDPKKYVIEDFNVVEYRKKIGVEENDFIVLLLAELNNNKNHIQIIKAMKELKDRYSKIKIVCAGEGILDKYLKSEVKKLNLEKQVIFLGFRNDVKELISSCDCVALLSKREGLGKCILEGMLLEKILVATNTRGPREIIDNEKNGFLVEVGNIKETVDIIEKIYLDGTLKKKFAKASQEKIKQFYLQNILNEVKKINLDWSN